MSHPEWLSKKLILCLGKGGVGKSFVARKAASRLAAEGKRTLLIHSLQLGDEEQRLENPSKNLWTITLRPSDCFNEYIILKLKLKPLYTAFLSNRITQYLEKAAPGVREMVLLGKIWFERENYDRVVVDMPSTGYALAMMNTPINFAALFPGGPIYRDAQDMLATFGDPEQTAFVTVTLAEEMPLQESLELASHLKRMFPRNPPWLVVNRLIEVKPEAEAVFEKTSGRDLLRSAVEHLIRKRDLQRSNLKPFIKAWPAHKPPLEFSEGRNSL